MSHIVSIKTQMKDPAAIAAACRRRAIPAPTQGTASIFGVQKTGTIIRLAGWHYPAVINRNDGSIDFDNYNGAWGKPAELDAFRQAYAIEKARIEAARKGFRVTETAQPDGSVRVEIHTP